MWKLYRDGSFVGNYDKLEAAMCIIGTGQIGVKWLPLGSDQFIGLTAGGAARFVINRET